MQDVSRRVVRSLKKNLWGIWFIAPPKDVSLDGYRIDETIQYTDAVITFYFSVVVLCMILFVIKYRSRPGHTARFDRGDSRKNLIATVAMGLLVFFSIDAVIEAMSFRDLKEAFWNFPRGSEVVRIESMPQQYAWNFRYAGPDGQFATEDDIIPPLNHMHIPVNRPVVIQIAPWDVIHSFYIPNFRVKVDATPGMINALWFQATETGTFEIACAELCGNGHYRMKGFLTVESEEDFEEWLKNLGEQAAQDDEWEEWFDEETDDETIPKNWGWPWKEIRS